LESIAGARPSLSLLLDQANFWLLQDNPQAAMQALNRAVQAYPDNVEALSAAAEVATQLGRPEAATLLERLRRVAPNDPRIRQAESAQREPGADAAALEQARTLARAGRTAEAVQRYRDAFRGEEPPPSRAVEFYSVLATLSDSGMQEARSKLGVLARRSPNDQPMQLAYAQMLTYGMDTRSEGIERLQRLAQQPATANQARRAWRQALLWQGADPEAADQIEAYLESNPGDPELAEKLTQARATRGIQHRMAGWNLGGAGRYADAEREFRTAIAVDPRDAESVIGLAVIRRRQGRNAEMKQLLDQAIEASPDRRDEFVRILGTDGVTPVAGGPADPAAYASHATLAWRALSRGDLDRADGFARRAIRAGGDERVQGEVVLGQVAFRREDWATAESRYRAALALRPKLPVALAGLYDTLQRQGRIAEADTLQQETGFRPPAGLTAARAYTMREAAFREEDPARRVTMLREALTTDPANPWIKVDLARMLRATGNPAEAREIEQDLARDRGAESSYAGALVAADEERWADAAQLLERVPARLRNADMNRLLSRSRQEANILVLESQVREGRPEARQRLASLAAQPSPGGTTGVAVVRAFGRLGDGPAAVAAAREAVAANPSADPSLRLALAGSLVGIGERAEAEALVAPLADSPGLPDEARRQIAALQASAIVTLADRLNQVGDRDAAYRQIMPALERQPDNPELNAALLRLNLANGRTEEARAAAEKLLAIDPRNQEARSALMDIAITRGDWSTAERLLAEARAKAPDDLRLALTEARLARARGDMVRSQRLLEDAARRRIAALQAGGAVGQAALTRDLLSPTRATTRAGQEPQDALNTELVRALRQARDETATWLQAGVGIRGHSGTGGLSRLGEISAPIEVSMPVPQLGGRVQIQTGTVAIGTGGFATGSESARQFGTGPLAGSAAPGISGRWTTGQTFGVGYVAPHVRADIGSTPLGFQQTNVAGGAELALPLVEGLNLRVSGLRRPMTESVLSYAGQRDPSTGRSWGGVMRTGARGQLEYAVNERFGVYGGGGWSGLRGENVASNEMVELGGGVYYAAIRAADEELTVGPDLRYFHFNKNRGNFTYGQGGYFSPQWQVLGALGADWKRQWGDVTTRVQATLGWQRFHEHTAPLFPTDSALQAQMEANSATLGPASTPARSVSGPIGGLGANVEYAVSPTLRLGAIGRFTHTGNYSDASGLLYLRWRLDTPPEDLAPLLAGTPTRYPAGSWPMPALLSNGAPEPVQLNPGAARPVW
ncbi:MAG: cellulose synthase subunit BcsC-related outer membrane protein, partial [Paracraurococcus sp.]